MLSAYTVQAGAIQKHEGMVDARVLSEARWIDMLNPSKEEESTIEALLGVEIPTPEEMRGVESSSQIYSEADAMIMTIRVISVTSGPSPRLYVTTFILTPARLVTLRYGDPSPFRVFAERLGRQPELLASSKTAMIGLLEAIVERAAEILETIGDELDKVSECLFAENSNISHPISGTSLETALRQIGRSGDLASRTRESLHSIQRVSPVLRRKQDAPLPDEVLERLSTLRRDVTSLLDHDAYLTSKIQFLLDSNLGLISIQQNAIIKIFSVAAVIFLPPTLIASAYGMNFQHIPELKWLYGYPFALALMLLSAVLPYWYFKQRRWL
jgi:magnesium transporter